MFAVSEISYSIGARLLFEKVSFSIQPGQRAGLVGPNGAGKTTLLKIIADINQPDEGRIIKPSGAVTGYLPQELSAEEFNGTVWAEASKAFEKVHQKARELEKVHQELAASANNHDGSRLTKLLERQHELTLFLEQSGFYEQDARTATVLSGLGFDKADFHRPLSQFSGGWKMRASLARLLLTSPDLLLLDEPTNHLDIDSVTWLEDWLMQQKGALLLVSHDEHFLNRLSQRIISLEQRTAVIYQGNYHAYLEQSAERKRQLEAQEKTRQAKIKETERFIERFRAKATKARQVQSRIKMLEREKQMNPSEPSGPSESSVNFSFPEPERSGRDVVVGEGIGKTYECANPEQKGSPGRIEVFRDLAFRIERGDHIAVVGPNGSGKSTLAKIIAGVVQPDSGTIKWGHNVSVSYFGQHQASELPQEATVLEAMGQAPGSEATQRVRDLLGAFLFNSDMVKSRVKNLSGGEKSRLALARMLLNPANLLVLDEPTNHLDITSKQVVKNALKNFTGSFVLVSHDRAFMEGIVSRVWEVRNGILKDHLGGIEDYLDSLDKSNHKPDDAEKEGHETAAEPKCKATATDGNSAAGNSSQKRPSARELRRQAALEREMQRKKLGPLKAKVKDAEEKLLTLETRKEELEALLAEPAVHADGPRMKKLNSEYKNILQLIDETYILWEKSEEALQTATKNLESA